MDEINLAAIMLVNSIDLDKDLPLRECQIRYERAPQPTRAFWRERARKYLAEVANEGKMCT